MGSERKKKKNRDSDSEQEDDRKTKRRRIERNEEPKSSKRDKPKKKKHHTDKEKKSKEKRKSKHDKHGGLLDLKIQELSSDDYFSKNNEFATWLKEEKDVFFSDLGSDSARKLFSKFVKEWNSKKLDIRYYEGIETAPRSAHEWKIKQ